MSIYSNDKTSLCFGKFLTVGKMNPNLLNYEINEIVGGTLSMKCDELEQELKQGQFKPFKDVIRANHNDQQVMGQPPITFLRQVCAVAMYPSIIDRTTFPDDVIKRVDQILADCMGNSLGSYCTVSGIPIIRQQVAQYIERRDGYKSNWHDVVLVHGATVGVINLLELFAIWIDCMPSGIMIPIPAYPLYIGAIIEFGLKPIKYYLDEKKSWSISIHELEKVYDLAKHHVKPRAIVIINPGNPAGQVLTKSNLQQVIQFAYQKRLFLIADEVYQLNVYDKSAEFHSIKKIIMEMGPPYNRMELASFMSLSKGYMGECGLRAGYVELFNIDPEVKNLFLTSLATQMCSSKIGQVAISCCVCPPKPKQPSYDTFIKEQTAAMDALKEKAVFAYKAFNSIDGFKCNPIQGAMSAFASVKLPFRIVQAAKRKGLSPDGFYCAELLEETGVCLIPGSTFGQKEYTFHVRSTILPPIDKFEEMFKRIKEFHQKFIDRYTKWEVAISFCRSKSQMLS